MIEKNKKYFGLGMLGLFLLSTLCFSEPVGAGPAVSFPGGFSTAPRPPKVAFINVTAVVLPSGGFAEYHSIDFGEFSIGSSSGTIKVSEGSLFFSPGMFVEGATGGITALNAWSSPLAPGESIAVTVVGQSLSGPGDSMVLDGFCQSPGSDPGPHNGPCFIVLGSSLTCQ